jgi:hypothetical protein
MASVLMVSFPDEDIRSSKSVKGHGKALYISHHMYGSKLHKGEEKYRRSLIVIVIHAFDLSFFRPKVLKRQDHKPPPPRIYSMAAWTFPPVAWRARMFCEALKKPMSFNCCKRPRALIMTQRLDPPVEH